MRITVKRSHPLNWFFLGAGLAFVIVGSGGNPVVLLGLFLVGLRVND